MKFRYSYIYGLFVLSFGILTILSVLFYRKLMEARESSDEVDRNYKSLFLLGEIDSRVKNVVSGENEFIISQDPHSMPRYDSLIPDVNNLLDSLRPLFNNNRQQVNLIRLKHIVNDRLLDSRTTVNKVINAYSQEEVNLRIKEGRVKMNDFQQLLDQMQSVELRLRETTDSMKILRQEKVPTFLYATFLFAAFSLIVSFFFVIRELKLRLDFQAQLQQQVGSLNRANQELEQLTHIASHHLQEPLRKIQTFSNQITTRHKALPEAVYMLLDKMNLTAQHMHDLTRDMVKYSTLINTQEALTFADLNYILAKVAEQVEEKLIRSQGQLIIANSLPVIKGIPTQLATLFEQLIDNAIKFSRKDIPPVITITYEEVTGNKIRHKIKSAFGGMVYCKISVADNGMGFDNKYIDKMFYLFQKLEIQQNFFQSKGIGLPMVQRIMINHGGNVVASGVAGEGAVFNLYFPLPGR